MGKPAFLFAFCFILLLLGGAYLSIIPPYQIPDEPEHLARIFSLARGRALSHKTEAGTGDYFCPGVGADLAGFNDLRFRPEVTISPARWWQAWNASPPLACAPPLRTQFLAFNNMAMYSPAAYLPQVLGAGVAEALSFRVLSAVYLVRIFSLLAFLGILFFSLREARAAGAFALGPLLFFLTPMNLSQAGSASADSFALALLIYTGALFYSGLAAGRLSNGWLARALVTAALLSLCKSVLFIYAFILLVPVWRQGPARWPRTFLLAAAALIPGLIWAVAARGTYSPLVEGADPGRQFLHLASRPLASAELFAGALYGQLSFLVSSYVGLLGWVDTQLRGTKVYFYLLALCAWAIPASDKRLRLKARESAYLFLIAWGGALMATLAIYLSFNPVGRPGVAGLVGRYFAPSFVLALIALPRLRLPSYRWTRWPIWFAGATCFFFHLRMIVTLLRRYWGL